VNLAGGELRGGEIGAVILSAEISEAVKCGAPARTIVTAGCIAGMKIAFYSCEFSAVPRDLKRLQENPNCVLILYRTMASGSPASPAQTFLGDLTALRRPHINYNNCYNYVLVSPRSFLRHHIQEL